MIANRDKVDVVEVITWNDYGESHYIGPIEGSQPNSQAWVDGMDHTGMFLHDFPPLPMLTVLLQHGST